jgi:transcription elongation factor Elf1
VWDGWTPHGVRSSITARVLGDGMGRRGVKGYMIKMTKLSPKISEHTCPACNGTGFPVVMQPVQPDRKIYPVQCKACAGKGKITDDAA